MPESNRMRIALFTYSTQPRGGVLHALALADALHDAGHDVVLHALDDTGRGFIRTPRCAYRLVPVERTHQAILPFVGERVAAYVAAWDRAAPPFDIYHAHDGISGNALATLTERGWIAGFIRTVHHIDDFGTPEMDALQTRAIVAATECLVVSDVWRRRLFADYGRRSVVVPNGVDTTRFVPLDPNERKARRAARPTDGSGPLFVTIGGVEARKNTLVLLDAFARVLARRHDARLVIAGGSSVLDHSSYRRSFDERLAELGTTVAERVELAGVLTDARIVELVQSADAFVFPSLVEGFGLVVLEALACGTPVVTSAIAPFTEFLTAADALLVDPRDSGELATAMLSALEDAVVTTAAQRGPALARRYTWAASAAAHVDAYRKSLAARSVAAHA